jgi:hypothetical protein
MEVTAKDLIYCIGLPCLIYDGGQPVPHSHIEGVDIDTDSIIAERTNYKPKQIKPMLKELENITVQEVVHMSINIMGYDDEPDKHELWHQNDVNQIKEFGMIQFDTKDSIYMPLIITYLMKQGYDLHLLPYGSYLTQDRFGKITNLNDFDEHGNLIKK